MTNQMQGETLFAGWAGGGSASDWAYTPWMPVQGIFATFGVEVLVSSGATLTWGVETRKVDDAATTSILAADQVVVPPVGSGTPVLSLAMNSTAAKELVRYRFSTGASASTGSFVTLRALLPSWQVVF